MALRTRKVEYVFDQRETSLASATRLDFASKTLTIAETSSRTFRSAIVEVWMCPNDASSIDMTSWLIGIKLGATAFDDVTVTQTLPTNGQTSHHEFIRDVTSYFNTNFGSGSTQTCQVGVKFGAVSSMNITVKLILTYEFDDSSASTRTKTVKIPLDSKTSALTNTLAEIGTNQVPALDTELPEASKTYKQVWFEIIGNTGLNGTTDSNLAASLDAESEHAFGLEESALNHGKLIRHHWIRDDMTTNAVHAFKLRVSNTVLNYACVSIVLCVTYTYDHSSTTSVYNSLEIPMSDPSAQMSGWTSSDKTRYAFDLFVPEPATIAMKQSGVRASCYNVSDGQVINLLVGSQSNRAYTFSLNVTGEAVMFSHRIDSGGAQGSALTLARGKNTFNVDVYASTNTDPPGGGLSLVLFLNYTSGVHADGDGAHNHTIAHYVNAMDATPSVGDTKVTSAVAPNLPESAYYLNAVGYCISLYHDFTPIGFNLSAERSTSDPGSFHSYVALMNSVFWGDSGACWGTYWSDATAKFSRYPNDPSNGLDIEVSRIYVEGSRQGAMFNCYMLATYHSVQFLFEGTVSGYTGDGSGITVTVHDATTNAKLASGTTAVGGTYSITVYDDTSNGFYAEVQQDATHVGRSANGTPTAA